MFSIDSSPNWKLYRVASADDAANSPYYLDHGKGINMAGYRWLLVLMVGLNTATPPRKPEAWKGAGVAPVLDGSASNPIVTNLTWSDELQRYVPMTSGFDTGPEPGLWIIDACGQHISLAFDAGKSSFQPGQSVAVFVAGYGQPDAA